MSRKINGITRLDEEHELYQKEIKVHKLLITRNNGKKYLFLMDHDRIVKAACETSAAFPIGTVVVGKVANVKSEMGGAFVNISAQEIGYLPLNRHMDMILLNRVYDGRILAGDEILVQIEKEAVKTKDPVVTTKLSISGAYCVVSLDKRKGGFQFSKKLSSAKKEVLKQSLQK